jgi:hypothetical protein
MEHREFQQIPSSAPSGEQAPPPYGPPPQWQPHVPAHKRGPAWLMPVSIVVAAILVAGGAIAVALISSKSGPPAPASAPTQSAGSAATSDADSSTCHGWRSTAAALDATPALPDGWDWDTPGIDAMIASRNAAITKAMDLFEPQVATQPADLASAANAYIKARRNEVTKLANHTYTQADSIPSTAGASTLDQLCHVK